MKRFEPGDIVEIKTPKGLAYVQLTHRHASYPEVIRALPGLYEMRPSHLKALVQQGSRFVAMTPLSDATELGLVSARKVETIAVPEGDRRFPTFKMAIRGHQDGVRGNIAYWWFWDGDGLTYDEHPDGEKLSFPLREVMPVTELVEKLSCEPCYVSISGR